ncbi:MAG: hypothetical protein HDKAJFGB_00862 [Anaerolineae bacterium]|nr:hypothetical protein [Anaerolineae bacterium]
MATKLDDATMKWFEGWFERIDSRFEALEARLTKVEDGLTNLETRVTGLEKAVDGVKATVQMNADLMMGKFDKVETRLNEVEALIVRRLGPGGDDDDSESGAAPRLPNPAPARKKRTKKS